MLSEKLSGFSADVAKSLTKRIASRRSTLRSLLASSGLNAGIPDERSKRTRTGDMMCLGVSIAGISST